MRILLCVVATVPLLPSLPELQLFLGVALAAFAALGYLLVISHRLESAFSLCGEYIASI